MGSSSHDSRSYRCKSPQLLESFSFVLEGQEPAVSFPTDRQPSASPLVRHGLHPHQGIYVVLPHSVYMIRGVGRCGLRSETERHLDHGLHQPATDKLVWSCFVGRILTYEATEHLVSRFDVHGTPSIVNCGRDCRLPIRSKSTIKTNTFHAIM